MTMKASERDIREWREVVSAIAQHIHDTAAPVDEGIATLPEEARRFLSVAEAACDGFDRAMAKIDGQSGASGDKYELVREWTGRKL
jgi:hypothetical protein